MLENVVTAGYFGINKAINGKRVCITASATAFFNIHEGRKYFHVSPGGDVVGFKGTEFR